MTDEQVKRIHDEIQRGHRDLGELRKDIARAFNKIESHKEELISAQKDVEFLKELMNEKFCEVKKDVNGIGEFTRKIKQELKEYVCEQIKRKSVATKLWIAVSCVMGMSAIIMFLLNKFIGGAR